MSMIEESKKINDLCNLIRAEYKKMETPFGKKSFIKTLNQLAEEHTDHLFKEMTKAVSSGYLLGNSEEKSKPTVAKRKKSDGILEGYWRPNKSAIRYYEKDDIILTYPDVTKLQGDRAFRGKSEFLAALSKVEGRAASVRYKGSSNCRICGIRNGSAEFSYRNAKWPEGYRHYVSAHNVKPSKEFAEFIMDAAKSDAKVSTR